MTDFDLSRRNFLKFSAALGVAAAVPASVVEAIAPPVAPEKFVGPRLEVLVDGNWIQIPGLTDLMPRQLFAPENPIDESLVKHLVDAGVPSYLIETDQRSGYLLEGEMDWAAIDAFPQAAASPGPYPMRVVWREMLIEFDGYVTKFDMTSFVDKGPRWMIDLVTTTQPRVHVGRV
jgi:hypothetical protein